jgi:hypothetical protein
MSLARPGSPILCVVTRSGYQPSLDSAFLLFVGGTSQISFADAAAPLSEEPTRHCPASEELLYYPRLPHLTAVAAIQPLLTRIASLILKEYTVPSSSLRQAHSSRSTSYSTC